MSQRDAARAVGCTRGYVERVASEHVSPLALVRPQDDARHWKACLKAGGFVWRELRGRQVVEFSPRRR